MPISRPTTFFNQLSQCLSLDEAKKIIDEERNYLAAHYNTLASLKNACTSYRNHFKQIEFVHPRVQETIKIQDKKTGNIVDINAVEVYFLDKIRLTYTQTQTFNARDKQQVVSHMGARRPLHNVDTYINKAQNILNGPSYLDKIIGLCALTGRRTAEIATSAEFDYIQENGTIKDHAVLFKGQLKTKNREDVAPYIIPIFDRAQRIIENLRFLRQANPLLINNAKRFHDCCSKDLGRRTKKHFQGFFHFDIKPKDLRSIYIAIAYELFCENKAISPTLYGAKVLGHGKDDIETVNSYDDFFLTENAV